MSRLASRRAELEEKSEERLAGSKGASASPCPDQIAEFSAPSPGVLTPKAILGLQQTQGNAFVRRMLAHLGLIQQAPMKQVAIQREDEEEDNDNSAEQNVGEVSSNDNADSTSNESGDEPGATLEEEPEGGMAGDEGNSEPENSAEESGETDSENGDNVSENTDDSNNSVEAIADCKVIEEGGDGAGHGGGVSVHVQGLTVANYDHGKPKPPPFPSTATKTPLTKPKGAVKVGGTLEATYTCSPTVTLPSVPAGLTDCQTTAVQTFIDTTLKNHENDHVNAFTSNYNGTVSLPLNFTVRDDPGQIEIGLTNAINLEDQKRVNKANAASAKLDPFNKPIPGLDCEK